MLKKQIGGLLFFVSFPCIFYAQNIRIDNLKEQFSWKNAIKVNGGISANTMYLTRGEAGQDAFSWGVSLNLNINLFKQFNLPFSFTKNSLSQGFSLPTRPDRLSIHPSYKWITTHIGYASMNFSPYTMNGIEFCGGGVELSPTIIPLTFLAMFGRISKPVVYDPGKPEIAPSYRRWGGGFQAEYRMPKIMLGISLFSAHDDPNSLTIPPPADLNILPEKNWATSIKTNISLVKNLIFSGEYGISFINKDPQASYTFFQALNLTANYRFMKNTIGIAYERVDPQYRTLGAYYFTNDLENITFNYNRPFWADKINLSFNIGLQRNNILDMETEKTNRWAGSLNLSYAIANQCQLTFGYSNFQSFTNKRDPFDYINGVDPNPYIDTLSFKQLSQNANINFNYGFGKQKNRTHTLQASLNFTETSSKSGGVVQERAQMKNLFFNSLYGLSFIELKLQLDISFNISANFAYQENSVTYGPSAGASMRFFKNTLSTGINLSYNSNQQGKITQGNNFNTRLFINYILFKKNIFSLSLTEQLQYVKEQKNGQNFSISFSYAYNF